jgi:hypothetical protein
MTSGQDLRNHPRLTFPQPPEHEQGSSHLPLFQKVQEAGDDSSASTVKWCRTMRHSAWSSVRATS